MKEVYKEQNSKTYSENRFEAKTTASFFNAPSNLNARQNVRTKINSISEQPFNQLNKYPLTNTIKSQLTNLKRQMDKIISKTHNPIQRIKSNTFHQHYPIYRKDNIQSLVNSKIIHNVQTQHKNENIFQIQGSIFPKKQNMQKNFNLKKSLIQANANQKEFESHLQQQSCQKIQKKKPLQFSHMFHQISCLKNELITKNSEIALKDQLYADLLHKKTNIQNKLHNAQNLLLENKLQTDKIKIELVAKLQTIQCFTKKDYESSCKIQELLSVIKQNQSQFLVIKQELITQNESLKIQLKKHQQSISNYNQKIKNLSQELKQQIQINISCEKQRLIRQPEQLFANPENQATQKLMINQRERRSNSLENELKIMKQQFNLFQMIKSLTFNFSILIDEGNEKIVQKQINRINRKYSSPIFNDNQEL